MKTFKELLVESLAPRNSIEQEINHIPHIEDYTLHYGHDGVSNISKMLSHISDSLGGKETSPKFSIHHKMDGGDTYIYGHHPETKQFFVAQKDDFKKNLKVHYTKKDINEAYGNNVPTAKTLNSLLTHLPKIITDGVYEGEHLYDKDSLSQNTSSYSFSPNHITYSVDKKSGEGKSIKLSKMGFHTTTKYNGKSLHDLVASPFVDFGNFKNHPDVYHVSTEIKSSPSSFPPESKKEYDNHMENAKIAYSKMHPLYPDMIAGHGTFLEEFVDKESKKKSYPTTKEYKSFIKSKKEKLLTEEHKLGDRYDHMMNDIENNKSQFDDLFKFHSHIQKAKNVLFSCLSKNIPYIHTKNEKQAFPHGFVVSYKKGDVLHMAKITGRSNV